VRASSNNPVPYPFRALRPSMLYRRFPQRAPHDCHRPGRYVMRSCVTDTVSPHHDRRPPLADHTSGGKRYALHSISTNTSFDHRDLMVGFGTLFHPLKEVQSTSRGQRYKLPRSVSATPPEWQGGRLNDLGPSHEWRGKADQAAVPDEEDKPLARDPSGFAVTGSSDVRKIVFTEHNHFYISWFSML